MASSFDEMTLLYSRFLRLIAILPFEGRSFASPTSRVLFAYYFVSSMLHWNMFLHYTINKFRTGEPTIDAICEAIISVGMQMRYYLLLSRRLEFANLLAECRGIWEMIDEEDRHEVRRFERKVRLLFVGLLGICYFTTFTYCGTAVVLNYKAARKANETHEAEYILPFKWYIPGVVDSWPGYKFNFLLQVMLVANAGTITSTVDSAAPILIMLGAGYFRVVQRRLYRIYDCAMKSEEVNDDSHVHLELIACCQLHQRILSYCTRINKIARTLFLVQLMCTGYNTSLIAIKFAGTDPDKYKYLTLGLLNLSQLFICQWAPDHLIDESLAISRAAYDASFPWMRHRVGKLLVLMIARAQRPVRMTAAGIVNLSLENFGYMLKGAVSFFTVLRNFTV